MNKVQGSKLEAGLKLPINPIYSNPLVPKDMHSRLIHYTSHVIMELLFLFDDDKNTARLGEIYSKYYGLKQSDDVIFRELIKKEIFPVLNNFLGGLGDLVESDMPKVETAINLVQEAHLKIDNIYLSDSNMGDLLYFNQTLSHLMNNSKREETSEKIGLLNQVLTMYSGGISSMSTGSKEVFSRSDLRLTVEKVNFGRTQPNYILLFENQNNQTFEVATIDFMFEVTYNPFNDSHRACHFIEQRKIGLQKRSEPAKTYNLETITNPRDN
jgi:hypothetical protein